MSRETLHHQLQSHFNTLFGNKNKPEVPMYISKSLKHDLRPYQIEALEHLIHVDNTLQLKHLLFLMATGSGKTNVLAASILHLYKEHGYQNFLFFVNSDAIIRKTAENLLNPNSSKYLFNPDGIEIDGQQIMIQVVEVFPKDKNNQTIYLKLTTIQKLHMDLTNPRENGLTYQSLTDEKLVLLSDEAHHINVQTKRRSQNETKVEAEERNWEVTVSNIMRENPENRMLEFTATLNLDDDNLFDKYKDKVLYQYDLPRFMNDGYSKNVLIAKHNENDLDKMLKAILLNQYRKYVGKDYGIDLKPVIMFKSYTIRLSQSSYDEFLELIGNISETTLKKVVQREAAIHKGTDTIWEEIYAYYNYIDLTRVIRDLQNDFTKDTILSVNSQQIFSEHDAYLLNTLEDINNPIRAIFAVAKLNEGWDVLNLFDIVRLSEKASATRNATDSEAQLIGRGARYYPFKLEGKSEFQRRFDTSGRRLSVLESLHYHTINESAYIKNLVKSLDSAGVQTKTERYNRYEAKIKNKFKETDFFKNGKIFVNRWIETSPEDYDSFKKYSIENLIGYDFQIAEEQHYGKKEQRAKSLSSLYKEVTLPLDKRLIQKSIQRNKFFHFSNLKEYLPTITTVQQFIDSPSFMGGIEIKVKIPREMTIGDLTKIEQLSYVENYLRHVEEKMRLNFTKEKGTTEFVGKSFSSYFDNYVIETNDIDTGVINERISSYSMRGQDWFIYDNAIVNPLEWNLINDLNQFVERLKKKYENVYLVRNERKVKFREFDGVRGFMPDFLLFMEDSNFTYQLFLEPKGEHLKLHDNWKQEFLLALSEREDIEVLHEGKEVRLVGFRFYSDSAQSKREFKEEFIEKTNIESIEKEFDGLFSVE